MNLLLELLSKDDIIAGLSQRIIQRYPDVRGKCELVAKDLAKELNTKGIRAKHVVGSFILDDPDADRYMGRDYWDDQEGYEVEHDWVEVEGKILDISARQFRKSVRVSIPDIVHIGHEDPLYSRYRFLNYYGG